jgi:Rho GDP-dissociation inhibitor
MAMEVAGRPDVAIDLSCDTAIEKLKSTTVVVKEGVEYRLKAKFSVSGDVISGLKYIHIAKKMGIRGNSA